MATGAEVPPHMRYVMESHVPGGQNGSYGLVYQARDTRTNQMVAVKRAHFQSDPNDPHDQGVPVTVVREASCLQALRHENILALRDIYILEHQFFFVFDLMSVNLRHYIHECDTMEEKWVPEDNCRSLFRQILSAVAYCHDRRILHRDMKPDNVLLDTTRQHAKVADFGMARWLNVRESGYYTDRTVTAWYRPPEILLGDVQYGIGVDIWSCGCILVEMMTLRPLFPCASEWECILSIFQQFGTPDADSWQGVTALPYFSMQFPQWQGMETVECLSSGADYNPYRERTDAVDLIRRMLMLNPSRRINAIDALENHPFFNEEPGTGAPVMMESGEEDEDEEDFWLSEDDEEHADEGFAHWQQQHPEGPAPTLEASVSQVEPGEEEVRAAAVCRAQLGEGGEAGADAQADAAAGAARLNASSAPPASTLPEPALD